MRFRLETDVAGRIILPLPVREHFRLKAGASIELEVEEDRIILRPRQHAEPLIEEREGILAHGGNPTGDLLKAIESVRMQRDRDNLGPAR